jgi:CHASE2 domain-containing sensor protein
LKNINKEMNIVNSKPTRIIEAIILGVIALAIIALSWVLILYGDGLGFVGLVVALLLITLAYLTLFMKN